MSLHSVDVARGYSALHAGEWQAAWSAFEAAIADRESAEALEGLSQASWWSGDEEGALSLRQRAHSAYRSQGDLPRAVRCALWVSEHYRTVHADHAAANGWLHRAERLLGDPGAAPAAGWLTLVRAIRSGDPVAASGLAQQALREAELHADEELEAYALAEIGLALVAGGHVEPGISSLDEAMALATAQANPMVAGDVACRLMQAAEMTGDLAPFMAWSSKIQRYMFEYGHAALIASCGTCCGLVFAGNGDLSTAERELLRTIEKLETGGHGVRCSHPSAALASLRVRQGRLEEAEETLAPYANLPEAVVPTAELLLARGEVRPAIKALERRLEQTGDDTLPAVPVLSLMAQARSLSGDLAGAADAADLLAAIAETSGLRNVEGLATLARARSTGFGDGAIAAYERSVNLLDNTLPLTAATARLELGRLIAETDRELAQDYVRTAHAAFEKLGAGRMADEAASLLRGWGVRGQTGAKRVGRLTERERQVLDLISHGLTNAEIADRLFISQKTAANHVGNVLMKLGVRSRTEAAAVALRPARSS